MGKKLLIVDDSSTMRAVIKKTFKLGKTRGYQLLEASNGNEALDFIRENNVSLLLLDLNMPEMDGYQVCQLLKSDPVTADCAVVFLSALDDVDTKVRGFALGGADYISKPFQAQEVIARVQTHARVIRLERELIRRDDTVWVMEDGKLSIREVAIAFQDGEYAYIESGVEAGESIVISDLVSVVEGAALRLAEDNQ